MRCDHPHGDAAGADKHQCIVIRKERGRQRGKTVECFGFRIGIGSEAELPDLKFRQQGCRRGRKCFARRRQTDEREPLHRSALLNSVSNAGSYSLDSA